jgi:purine-binding chemotaxis protein CheW
MTPSTQYLTFLVGDEEYAVEILHVREVMEVLPITRMPATPTPIRGVVNVRGAVVPIVDLGVRFGRDEIAITRWTCIVVVEAADRCMGLLVDRVNQVIELDVSDIEPVPQFGVHVRLDFLAGMAQVAESFILLLDLERVVSVPDLLGQSIDAVAALDAPLQDAVAETPSGAALTGASL